ncbi:hypothetical protein [Bacillus sp. UNC438CL73TsuS30]|uniref:hypothetical protein n=1 Tax=Bacillus sp. UNC438CL73TsuS30 TaxID=1340434 RepID=UPI00047C4F52|nr:hypothetical protein [Bacillus sp. UNC438CL73TsuS30]
MSLKIYADDMEIIIDGESEVFNGLVLQVKAIKALIETLDFKFAQEEDMEASQKSYLVLLDAIGAMLKVEMPVFDNDETPNIETVNQFLTWILEKEVHKQPGYAELLDQDEEDNWY